MERNLTTKFVELFESFELWEYKSDNASKFQDLSSKIESGIPENNITEKLKSISMEVLNTLKIFSIDEISLCTLAVILLGELKVKESVELIINTYDLAFSIPMNNIDHYYDNWQSDEYAILRSACIKSLSKIDDPKGYKTIFLATQEWHWDISAVAREELTFDKFKYITENHTIFDLKKLKYPDQDSHLPDFSEEINQILNERGYGIQKKEHQLAETVVYSYDNLDDYQVEANYIQDFVEDLSQLDIKEFIKYLINEILLYQQFQLYITSKSAYYTLLFHLLGNEMIRYELKSLESDFISQESKLIIDDLYDIMIKSHLQDELNEMINFLEEIN